MRRTLSNRLSNRLVAVMVAGFSVIAALMLRANPFGDGTIPWTGAIAVALAGNALLAYVVVGWAAPYIASTGGRAGADAASPRATAVAERWLTATLLGVGLLAIFAVDFANRDLIISPTQRTQRNAMLVRDTVEAKAPEEFKLLLTAADTWKMSKNTYRSCVPSSKDESRNWCVLVQGTSTKLRVTRYGPGPSNAEQFLIWHPEMRGKRKAD
ncbi:MAG: hypothetical protein WAP35_10425 [Solirubrobacterales bacterium]